MPRIEPSIFHLLDFLFTVGNTSWSDKVSQNWNKVEIELVTFRFSHPISSINWVISTAMKGEIAMPHSMKREAEKQIVQISIERSLSVNFLLLNDKEKYIFSFFLLRKMLLKRMVPILCVKEGVDSNSISVELQVFVFVENGRDPSGQSIRWVLAASAFHRSLGILCALLSLLYFFFFSSLYSRC